MANIREIRIPAGVFFSVISNEEGTIIKIPEEFLQPKTDKKFKHAKGTLTLTLDFVDLKRSSIDSDKYGIFLSEVTNMLNRYGKVYVSRIANNKFIAEFNDDRDANDAIRELDNKEISGYKLYITSQ